MTGRCSSPDYPCAAPTSGPEGHGLTEWEALQRRDFIKHNPPPQPHTSCQDYEADMAAWQRRLDTALARRTAQRQQDIRLARLERVFPTGETRAAPAEPDACSRTAEGGWVCQAELDYEALKERTAKLSADFEESERRLREALGATSTRLQDLAREMDRDWQAECERRVAIERGISAGLQQRLTEQEVQSRHWRANHDEAVRRKRVVTGLYAASLRREADLLREAIRTEEV